MGIKNLNPFLKEKCPQAFKDVPYSQFRGKRMAVDSDNVLRKLMSRAHKEIVDITDVCVREPDRKQILERWLVHIKEEIIKFLKHGITLIFVFDGSYIDEKSDTQLKRREEKAKRIQEAEEMKRKVLSVDELERTPSMITELRKKMHHLGTIKSEDKQMAIQLLKNLGFPVLFATEEGEKLCAMLGVEGKVDCVYSRDTDIVAMGCPLSMSAESGWVYNPETQKTELSLSCVFFKPILATLEMEYETFLDLCIMAGCDFNNNIFRLGVTTAYKLLKTCKSIDNLPEKYNDKKAILNHLRCREIFKRQRAVDICSTDIILNIDLSSIHKNRNQISLDWYNEISSYLTSFPIPSDTFIEKTPSLSSSIVRLKILNSKETKEDQKSEPEISNLVSSTLKILENKDCISVPIQKASPKKVTTNIISSMAANQLQRYKERQVPEKKILKLKILPS